MVNNDFYIINTQHLRFVRKFDYVDEKYAIELHFVGVPTPEILRFNSKRKDRDEFYNEIVEKMKNRG